MLGYQRLQSRVEGSALKLLSRPNAFAAFAVNGKAHNVFRALFLGGELQKESGRDLNDVVFILGQIFCENVVNGIGAKKHEIALFNLIFHTVKKNGIRAVFNV